MRNVRNNCMDKFKRGKRAHRRVISILTALALAVSCGAFWDLCSAGVAMANEDACGREEYQDDGACPGEEPACEIQEEPACEIPEPSPLTDCRTDEAADPGTAADGQVDFSAQSEEEAGSAAWPALTGDEEEKASLKSESGKDLIPRETTYEAESGHVAVKVKAPAGSLPEGAALSVALYDRDSQAYGAAKEALGLGAQAWQDHTLIWTGEEDNLLVLDISFLLHGVEIEPAGPVEVVIDAAQALPENADIGTLEVSHLKETEGGVEAVVVADAGDKGEGSVDEETAEAMFCVDSLSPFTVVWSVTGSRTAIITVHTYDMENGNAEITSSTGSYAFTNSQSGYIYTTTLDIETLAAGVKLGTGFDDYYTLGYATAVYNNRTTYGDADNPLRSIDIQQRSIGSGSTVYTFYYGSSSASQTHASNSSSIVTVNLYYEHVEASVTISASVTAGGDHVSGYALSQTTEHFDYGQDLEISWSVDPEGIGQLTAHDDGTADLVWLDEEQDLSGKSVTVIVTAKGTNKHGEKVEVSDAVTLSYDAAQVKTVEIEDDIKFNGDLLALVRDQEGTEILDHSGLTFVWYMSDSAGSETDDSQSMIDSLLRSTTYTQITSQDVFDVTDDEEPDDDRALNVARERGGLHAFYVEVYDKTDTGLTSLLAVSEAFYVPYAMKLLNGSFEYPNAGNNMLQTTYDGVPYWGTTANDRLIEIVSYANSSGWGTQYNNRTIYAGGSQAAAGDQYAELNAESYGALYQDVLTAPGSELTWHVSHRARTAGWSSNFDATNAMYVVTMSANDAEMLLSGVSQASQQDVVLAMLQSAGAVDSSGVQNVTYTLQSGTYAGEATVTFSTWYETVTTQRGGAWNDGVNGTYTVPTDQYLTRFFFVAEHGYSPVDANDPTVGNLLDMAEFSQAIAWHIDIYIYNAEMDTYELQDDLKQSGTEEVFEYVYATYDTDKYHLAGSVTGSETGGEAPSFDRYTHDYMMLDQHSNYLSLYLMENGAVVRKTLEGFTGDQMEEIFQNEAESGDAVFSLSSGDTVVEGFGSFTVNVGDEGTGLHILSPLENGTYTLTETDFAGTLLGGRYIWQKVTASVDHGEEELLAADGHGKYALTFDLADYAEIEFFNYYVPLLTIEKVDGDDPDITLAGAEFILSKTVNEDGENRTCYYTSDGWVSDKDQAETLMTGEDGIVTAGLWDGTEGAAYILTETRAPDGYLQPEHDVTFTVDEEGKIQVTGEDPLVTVSEEGYLIIQNIAGKELPLTGGSGTWPYILFGLLSAGAAAGCLYRNRRRDVIRS